MSDDSKMIVETTGDFMLLDPHSKEEIDSEGFTTVTRTQFVLDKIADGSLKEKAPPAPAPKATPAKDK